MHFPAKIKRIEFVDLAKGISIFLVILGHSASNEALLSGHPSMMFRVIFAVHMPLFFMLSGLSMSGKPVKGIQEWKQFLRKNILAIVVPYFIWALIYCAFSYKNLLWIIYASWQALVTASTLTSLWYLPCLFVARIIVAVFMSTVITKVPEERKVATCAVLAIPMMIVGMNIPYPVIGYPWNLNLALIAAGFILSGYAMKDFLLKIADNRKMQMIMLGISTVLFLLGTVCLGDGLPFFNIAAHRFYNQFLYLADALTGSFMIFSIAMLLSRRSENAEHTINKRPLIYIGQHTMGIYLLHKPFLQEVIIPLMYVLLPKSFPEAPVQIIASFITLQTACWGCRIIEHFLPELIGKFPDEIVNPNAAE